MVTAPKPPGSRTSISPHAAVLLIARANVLQGAVRLHGLASSPPHETYVRVACALIVVARNRQPRTVRESRILLFFMGNPFLVILTYSDCDIILSLLAVRTT